MQIKKTKLKMQNIMQIKKTKLKMQIKNAN